MTMATRNEVADALMTLLLTSADYNFSSRRFHTWDQLQSVQKPALLLLEYKESHAKNKLITPAVRTLEVDVYIFTADAQDPNTTPIETLDDILDAIDPVQGGALKPDFQGKQTLGGLVTDCFIEGEIVKVPGDINGNGYLFVPIKIIFMAP